MKLIVCDPGDLSVGIQPCSWSIDCPFEQAYVDEQILEEFRQTIKELYRAHVDMKVEAVYDFEIKAQDEYWSEIEKEDRIAYLQDKKEREENELPF